MKKIFSILLFIFAVATGYAQSIGQFKTLRLVNLTDSTSVTPINGSIYYNTQSNKFRAYQAGAWYDLLGGGGGGGSFWALSGPSALTGNTSIDAAGFLLEFYNVTGQVGFYTDDFEIISNGFTSIIDGDYYVQQVNPANFTLQAGTNSSLSFSTLGDQLFSNTNLTITAVDSARFYIENSFGLPGQVLTSDGSKVSWQNSTGGGSVTSVGSTTTDLTVVNPTTTPSLTVVQAPALRSATTTVNVSSATAPSNGQVLTATSSTAATWQTPSAHLTNTAANNEMAKSNGTNLVPSGIGSNAAGNLQLGGPSGYVTGTDRSISATGTESNINLSLYHKGSSHTILRGTVNDLYWRGANTVDLTRLWTVKNFANDIPFLISASDGIIGSVDGTDLNLKGGSSVVGGNGGDVVIQTGQGNIDGTARVEYSVTGSFNISGIVESVLLSGTTLTLDDDLHRGKIIYCTSGSAITITVPSGLPLGFNCVLVQDGAGTVSLSASGTTLNGKTATTGTFDAISLAYYKSSETYIGF